MKKNYISVVTGRIRIRWKINGTGSSTLHFFHNNEYFLNISKGFQIRIRPVPTPGIKIRNSDLLCPHSPRVPRPGRSAWWTGSASCPPERWSLPHHPPRAQSSGSRGRRSQRHSGAGTWPWSQRGSRAAPRTVCSVLIIVLEIIIRNIKTNCFYVFFLLSLTVSYAEAQISNYRL